MASEDSLTGKTPANTRLDLLHMNNLNAGVDSALRSIYGGNGEETPIQISTSKVAIDFGEGVADKPQIKNARWTWQEHTGVTGTNYTVSFLGGNYHKVTLSGNLTNLVISDSPSSLTENQTGEITILIDAQNTYSITNWPTTTLWTSGTKPNFGTQANNGLLLVKLFTLDGGTTWYGQILATNLRSSP